MEIPVGVYYVPGRETLARNQFIHAAVEEGGVTPVCYEQFCESLGQDTRSEIAGAAFRAAIEALLFSYEMPILLLDTVSSLDDADIALYGFDGPSKMRSLSEEVKDGS